jgi:hypothetical protein
LPTELLTGKETKQNRVDEMLNVRWSVSYAFSDS